MAVMKRSAHFIKRNQAALIIVDVQERLWPAMDQKEVLLQNIVRLAKGADILGIRIIATEQYRKGLGATLPELAAAVAEFSPIEKLSFSACGAEEFVQALRAGKMEDVVLCGIEAHVCVSQTCLDLISEGFRVFVVADAVASRTEANCRGGLERMRAAGATLVTTEMLLFELLERAGTSEFKAILQLIR